MVSGETITYQYDSLKRLISATSSASWGENYGYDAFGSLVSKTPTAGSPPTLSIGVNPANNQIVGQTYDNNGNELSAPAGGTLTYDSENRLLTAPGVQYAYDSKNKRVWAGTLNGSGILTAQEVFVYGAGGEMLGEYSITIGSSSLTVATTNQSVYFGSKRIGLTNSSGVTTAFSPDQLGSAGQYYSYGEGKGGNNPSNAWSFATYWRDSATGLDYADQRYYSNQFGRFMSSDPYSNAANPSSPQAWNQYAYVLGDPMNSNDPEGLIPSHLDQRPIATINPRPDFVRPSPPPPPPPAPTPQPEPGPTPQPSPGAPGPPGPPIGPSLPPGPSPGTINTPNCGPITIQYGMTIPPSCYTCPAGQTIDGAGHCVSQGQYQLEVQCSEARNALRPLQGAALALAGAALYPGPWSVALKVAALADSAAAFADQLFIDANCDGVPVLSAVPPQ